ncbi:MAG: peptide deformylase [Chitinivibrionia bacterium]|nr:peptide deformylase [Chitinivibrionia bacterium]
MNPQKDDLEIYGSKLLRETCKEVSVFDDELVNFTNKLRELMYEFDGVGLAAVQVGVPLRIAVIDIPDTEKEAIILINPEIVWSDDETQTDSEGCLSIPDVRANVARSMNISVKAVSPNGEPIFLDKISGFFARVIQHEIDHLNGVLFTDRIDPVKKTFIAGKLKKIAKERKNK